MKTVAVWTILPIIRYPAETVLNHVVLLLDVMLSERYLALTKDRNVYRTLILVIVIIQVWQIIFAEVRKGGRDVWVYWHLVPVVASAVN